MIEFIELFYVITGVVSLLMYVPIVHRLYVEKSGAESTSIIGWTGWLISCQSALLYMIFITHDKILITMALIELVFTFIVVVLAVYKRITKQKGEEL